MLLSIATSLGNSDNPADEKLRVVATNSIIGDWVREIASDQVELVTIVGTDTDNHTFEPTPQNGVQLTKANIIFENGLGLEYWLDALYKSANSGARRVVLSKQLTDLLPIACHGHFKCSHAHQERDPHIWLNPVYAMTMVQAIADTLIEKDPKHEKLYRENSLKYIEELKKINAWIIEQVKLIPESNRKLITNHDSFRYFSRQYGFIPLGDILGSTSTDSIDPSASQFAKLVKVIQKNKVPAIFGENIQNSVLINKLAHEAKLPQPRLLYTEALSNASGPAKNYIEMMRYNTQILVESLK